MEPRVARHRTDRGGLVLGALVIVVGVYYLFKETLGFDIPELNWDQLWPLILIVIGGLILYGAWTRRQAT